MIIGHPIGCIAAFAAIAWDAMIQVTRSWLESHALRGHPIRCIAAFTAIAWDAMVQVTRSWLESHALRA